MPSARELDARVASAQAMARGSEHRLAVAREHAEVSRRLWAENNFAGIIAGSLGLTRTGDRGEER